MISKPCVLHAILFCLLCCFTACQPPQHEPETRPYGVGYNFLIHEDSLLLQEDRPMHWCQGVAENSDSLLLFRGNQIVVAAITVIPEDCVDSVWVKVARDQFTMGWTHEKDLLAAASPDDPISQFIRIFSGSHLTWFLICMATACMAIAARYRLRRHISLLHIHDIPSAYPTLLSSTLAVGTTLYAYIQHYVPDQWVHFYFHPTLNPLAQPIVLCAFLLCVWLMLLLTLSVANAAFSQLQAVEGTVYLLALIALCATVYLVLTLAAEVHVLCAALLCIAYILLAFLHYFRHIRAHYLCGRCGAKLRQKGRCPRCGAIND